MGCACSGESKEFQTRDNPSSINTETVELKSIPLNSEYGKAIFKTKINNIESNGFLCNLPIFVSGSVLPVMIFCNRV